MTKLYFEGLLVLKHEAPALAAGSPPPAFVGRPSSPDVSGPAPDKAPAIPAERDSGTKAAKAAQAAKP